ncbi:MAG: hypothetical protein B6I26_07025 [Desulfobacteraceae bacterium 4572_130]|nr:MAG: hypothetical protein B6I26_07025 [Desulfobacteraceae bacterium 4572_130]
MKSKKNIIFIDLYNAILFDLDGVVTKTASIHANAWKMLFDEYLQKNTSTQNYIPFDIKKDYNKYIDGKPRYKAIQDFIVSRNINIEYGFIDDASNKETICGLCNRKNDFFLNLLEKNGVEVYQSTINFILEIRKKGLKTAIVSSSKNCARILKIANITDLFDAKVDGISSEKLNIKGKPEPYIFLEAAKKLNVSVKKCIVVEDAVVGVEAGKKGKFGLVIGVDRAKQRKMLKQKGAHIVVNDLSEINMVGKTKNLPHALNSFNKVINLIENKEVMIFLNYNVIISSVVSGSQKPLISQNMKKILTIFAKKYTVCIFIEEKFKHIKKIIPTNNIHYIKDYNRDVLWILEKLNIKSQCIFPIYIGDGIRDESIFKKIIQNGVSIITNNKLEFSKALFRLNSGKQVEQFLLKLIHALNNGIGWSHIYGNFSPEKEGIRESLCALGNGYFVTRGAAPEAETRKTKSITECNIHYPGTYLAGGYNRVKTKLNNKIIENEDLVNMPNWLCLKFRILDGDWFQLKDVKILFYKQSLDIKKGVLNRTIRFRDKKNRHTIILQKSFVHAQEKHNAGLMTFITPLNWKGRIEICSAIDGRVRNLGVKRYYKLNNKHLEQVESRHIDKKSMILKMQTNQSRIDIAIGARTEIFLENRIVALKSVQIQESDYIAQNFTINIGKGETLGIEKLICLYTSRDTGISESFLEVEKTIIKDFTRFSYLLKSHITAWELLWRKFDCRLELNNIDTDITQNIQKTIRLYIFHLLQSFSMHSLDIDVGMPARGWHGEAYRGHIFWDEIIIFPFLNYRAPQITKTLLMYRYRRLKEATRAAKKIGCNGAMYPWQSGSSGREETQKMHLNPESGRWLPDNTYLQRHVNTAIVYNIWQYHQISGDLEFLSFYGGEIIIEIARFWASLAKYNKKNDRYEILQVMGPDEYHDKYPLKNNPGIDNNAYTNMMVAFVMDQALKLRYVIPEQDWEALKKKLDLLEIELEKWREMSCKMKIIFHKDKDNNEIISQFEEYENLKEFDWENYKNKHKNIQRLDRILEKENNSSNNYKICKQADVLMLFYLFSDKQLKKIFHRLGYNFDRNTIPENIKYYLNRTSNGSSLAWAIHAWIETKRNKLNSWKLFKKALKTDIDDIQEGTTMEGIHLAAMAGCIDILQRSYTGLEARSNILIINPLFPQFVKKVCFHIRYRKHWLDLDISQNRVKIKSLTPETKPITIMIKDEIINLYPGQSIDMNI